VHEYENEPAVLNVRLTLPEILGMFAGAPVADAKVTLWTTPPSDAHVTVPPRAIVTDVGLNAKVVEPYPSSVVRTDTDAEVPAPLPVPGPVPVPPGLVGPP